MIRFYPFFAGTDTSAGFEVLVIAMRETKQGVVTAICIEEEGMLSEKPIETIRVDYRYDRKHSVWLTMTNVEDPDELEDED